VKPRRLGAAARTGVLLVTAAAAACRQRPASRPAVSPQAASASPAAEAVDRLRALGYVGFTSRGAQARGVVLRDAGASQPGYSLFTNHDLCSAALVDEGGALANYWEASPCGRWSNAVLLGTGDLIVLGVEPGSRDPDDLAGRRYLLKLGWNGAAVWKRPVPAHHDLDVGPDGRLLTLLAVSRTIPAIDPARPVRDSQLALLTPEGELIERKSLYDLFRAAPERVKILQVKEGRGREVDLFHANSVQWMRRTARGAAGGLYAPSNVLVSVRHQDAAVIVDWNARRLLWAWGQGEVSGPHDATLLDNGNVLLFDNGLSRRWSRVVEVDPLSRRIVWEYRAPRPADFFSVSRGSSQRLPNGNTLIAESDAGHAFEVTPPGRIVWDFWNPFGNARGERATIVRIRRYDRARIEELVRRYGEGRRPAPGALTAGTPASAASASAPR
jgi:hypothetical protein